MKTFLYFVLSGTIALFSIGELHGQGKKAKRPDSPTNLEPTKAESGKPLPKPKLNSILKESCPFKFGAADTMACIPLEYIEYHPSGRTLLFLKYDNGRIQLRTYFKYDNAGNRTEELLLDEDSLFVSRTTYAYDVKGNLTEESKHDAEGLLKEKTVLRYDAGKKVEEIMYDSEGQIKAKVTHAYDVAGNKLESSHFQSDGTLETKDKFVYDAKKNKTEQVTYDSDGRVKSKTTYKYDGRDNLTEEATYESDGSIALRLEYRYDQDGNKIEFARFKSEGKLEEREKYKYAGKSRTEAAVFNAEDQFMNKTAYIYDRHGTMEREVEHDKLGEPQRMVRYVIGYFP